MIYTCFQPFPVNHTGSRCKPGFITVQHENNDWLHTPRFYGGIAQRGGLYHLSQPTADDVQQGLEMDRVARGFNGWCVLDEESQGPILNDPPDPRNVAARMAAIHAEFDSSELPPDLDAWWAGTHDGWHRRLWKLWGKSRPHMARGRYGYPLMDYPVTDTRLRGMYSLMEFGHTSLHGDRHDWTERCVTRIREWQQQFGGNTTRKPLIQHMPDLWNRKADRERRKYWANLWESGEFVMYLWHGSSDNPTIRAAIERYIREEFPS